MDVKLYLYVKYSNETTGTLLCLNRGFEGQNYVHLDYCVSFI